MRKYSFFLILCTALLVLVSCSKKKKDLNDYMEENREAIKAKVQMTLDSNDTAAVYNLTNEFLGYLENKDLDAAIGMLRYLKDGEEIVSLPEGLEKTERLVLGNFMGLKYKIDELRFHKETDCQVRYTATLFETDDPATPNKVSFFIKPVRRGGQWYLTMADTMSDSTEGSDIQN